MNEIDEALARLRQLFGQEVEVRQRRAAAMSNWDVKPRAREELVDRLGLEQRAAENQTKEELFRILTFPRQHIASMEKLEEFHAEAGFDKSVFIMTKFPREDPDEQDDSDRALIKVITAVQNAVRNAGYTPRLASDREYHPLLWQNVVLYMLGSERGVAILEDQYRDEFNPNVAMEWGWMRGMRRDVLFLVEEGFDNQRADVSGLTSKRFDWADPDDDIERAVSRWLRPDG